MSKARQRHKTPDLQVILAVSAGVVDVVAKPRGVTVAICDYDIEGTDKGDADVSKDPNGRPCSIKQWDRSEEIVVPENCPITKKAREGSYCRTWTCPDCGWMIEHSYKALAEVGTPICPDCDTETEML